jgi:NTE family protein
MSALIINNIKLFRFNFLFVTLRRIIIIFLVMFLYPSNPAHSQSMTIRPKVGLALSGGGSAGLAHIGVLKVMEEAGLRPDIITGVSMGSIIGGLYAIGYTADSIEKLCKSIDWNLIITNNLPENKIIYPEKKYFNNNIISIPLELEKSIIPSGLINGQQMEKMLSYYTWPAARIDDFSKLPIPFMCLATNLVTCKKTELTGGFLSDALRASSAVPTIFTPLKIDSLLLIDGGMVRNLAVSETHDMGASIVIGSYTGSYMSKEEDLQTVTDILSQLLFFIGVDDFEKQKKYADILIEPMTDDLSSTSFENIDTIIQRGYRAALPFKKEFRRIADSLDRIESQPPIDKILNRQLYSFDEIRINGNKKISRKQILGILNIKPYQNVDKKMITERIDLLYGKNWFDKVKYRIVPRNDSLILMIDCTELSKTMLYASIHYDNGMRSGLILRFSVKNPLIQKSKFETDAYIGQYFRARSKYIQFVDHNQKYGISLNFYAENTLIPMMELRGETGNTLSRNFYPGISLFKRFGLNHMVNISGTYESLSYLPQFLSPEELKYISYNYANLSTEYNMNTLDIKNFPSYGAELQLSAGISKLLSYTTRTSFSSDRHTEHDEDMPPFEKFYTISGHYRHYFSPSKKLTFGLGADFLYITNTDSVSQQNNFYFLGGMTPVTNRSLPMAGFHPGEISVRKMAETSAEVDYEMLPAFHIGLIANYSLIRESSVNEGYSFLSGYGFSIGYSSIFGPLRVGIMRGSYKKEKYFSATKGFISLGYNF